MATAQSQRSGESWMRKGMWSAATVVGLLAGAGMMLGFPAEVRAADGRVVMNDQLKFDPSEITVAAGTKVVWHNDGYVQHDVTADNGSFDSKGLIDRGGEYSFTFSSPGDYTYYCSPHKDAGMKGVIHVTGAGGGGGGATNTTATTATGTPAPGATTTSTAAAPAGATTTTTRPGAAASGQSTTTTTAPAAGGVTSTTQAASTTPTSASENAGNSSGAATGGAAEEAGADHGSQEAAEKKNEKSSPIGIAFASVSTLLLAAIAGKLLASKP
jgi:plastocyanin